MNCPRCEVEMVNGIAIKPKYPEGLRSIMPLKHELTLDEMKIIDVLKCPKCGYSDAEECEVKQWINY